MKKVIRLTEGQLKNIIEEQIKNKIKEDFWRSDLNILGQTRPSIARLSQVIDEMGEDLHKINSKYRIEDDDRGTVYIFADDEIGDKITLKFKKREPISRVVGS